MNSSDPTAGENEPGAPGQSAQTPADTISMICVNAEQTEIWQGELRSETPLGAVEAADLSNLVGKCYLSIWRDLPLSALDSIAAEPADVGGSSEPIQLVSPDNVQKWVNSISTDAVLEEIGSQARRDVSGAERIALPIAWVILLVATRRLIPSIVPLIAGISVSVIATFLLPHLMDEPPVATFATSVITMIGLALGVDYALLCVRWYWRDKESDELGNDTSPSPFFTVWVAALAVASGAAALLLVPVDTIRYLASGVILACLVAGLLANTFVPALASVLRVRNTTVEEKESRGVTERFRPRRYRNQAATPRIRLIVGGVITGLLVVLALQSSNLETGLTNPFVEPGSQTPTDPYADRAAQEFLQVQLSTVRLNIHGEGREDAVSQIVSAVATNEDVAPIVLRLQSPDEESTSLMLLVVHPWEEQETSEAVLQLTSNVFPAIEKSTGTLIRSDGPLITYASALDAVGEWQIEAAVFAAISTAIVLTLAQRRPAMAVLAVAGTLLSFAAALGALALILDFQLFGISGPLEAWVPVVMFCFLMGLGVDYHVFLTGFDSRSAVPVVVASACIMLAIFGGFAFGEQMVIRQLGLGLALGIGIDAFVLRLGLYRTLGILRQEDPTLSAANPTPKLAGD